MGSAGVAAAEFATRPRSASRRRRARPHRWRVALDRLRTVQGTRSRPPAWPHTMRTADRLGLDAVEPVIDLPTVWRRVRAVQAQIATTNDHAQRFRDIGVEVIARGTARVTAVDEVTVHTRRRHGPGAPDPLRPRRHRQPPAPTGHSRTRPPRRRTPATTLFSLDDAAVARWPSSGADRWASRWRRRCNGWVSRSPSSNGPRTLLPREDPTLVGRLDRRAPRRGRADPLLERRPRGALGRRPSPPSGRRRRRRPAGRRATVDGILLASGPDRRTPTDSVSRSSASMWSRWASTSTTRGRTRGPHDLCRRRRRGRPRRAATASQHGRPPRRRRGAQHVLPRAERSRCRGAACVFTDPELASVGMTIEQAEASFGGDADSWRFDLTHNDRARTDATADGGFVVVTGKGRIVGAHVLAPGAGDVDPRTRVGGAAPVARG